MTDEAPIENGPAEAALLGALLAENRLLDMAADRIEASDFYNPVHQRIFAAIQAEAGKGKVANAATLKPFFDADEQLETMGGIRYLLDLSMDATGLFAPVELADQIRDLADRRRMRAGLQTACEACADFSVSHGEIVEHADAALAGRDKDSLCQMSAGECFDALVDSFDDRDTGVVCERIPSLDKVLGPLLPKQLVIAAGRPGMGKTAVALSYALGAAMQGHGVLFVSLEMSAAELTTRMAADLCYDHENDHGIPFHAIRDKDLSPNQRQMVARVGSSLRTLPFQVIDAGSLTTGRLAMLVRRHARRMKANGHRLDLVVIDYLQLLSPDTKGRSNYEAVSEVSRSLKALAKDNGVAVLALAQLSREVEKRGDKRPQLSDLRDSGQIEQDADAVLFLLRKEYYLRLEEPTPGSADHIEWQQLLREVQGQLEFIVAKRRNGTTGTETGTFHGFYQAVRG